MPKTPKIAEIKSTQIIGKTSSVHGLRDLILLKCPYYTKYLKIKINPYQNPNVSFFFYRNRRFLKFIWKHKESEIIKPILRNKNKARSLTLPDFKTFYKGIVIKTLWRWHKDTFRGQWNRREIPEIYACMYI